MTTTRTWPVRTVASEKREGNPVRLFETAAGRIVLFGVVAVVLCGVFAWGVHLLNVRLAALETSVATLTVRSEVERSELEGLLQALQEMAQLAGAAEDELTHVASLVQEVRTQVADLSSLSREAGGHLDTAVSRSHSLADGLESHETRLRTLDAQTLELQSTLDEALTALRSSDLLQLAAARGGRAPADEVVTASGRLALQPPALGVGGGSSRGAGTDDLPEWIPYPVRLGDNLWNISTYFTGNPLLYREIAAANALEEGARIYPGRWLRIPSHIIMPEAWEAGGQTPGAAQGLDRALD